MWNVSLALFLIPLAASTLFAGLTVLRAGARDPAGFRRLAPGPCRDTGAPWAKNPSGSDRVADASTRRSAPIVHGLA